MAADSGRLREACAPAHTGSGTRSIQVIAWLSVLLTGLRHGDYAHRCSRGIPSWRRGHLSALRHSHPAHKYFSANPAWQDCLEPVQNRSLADSRPIFGTAPPPTGTPEPSPRGEAVFWPVFGTATLPTSTSVPSSRGKTVWNRCQTGLWPMPRPVFGTAPQSTGASVASRRGEAVFNRRFGTATLPTGTPVPSPRGEAVF